MSYQVDGQSRYAVSHEWARVSGKTVTIGLSDYAQHVLSDVVYVELPDVGDSITAGEAFGSVESVKAAADINAPVSGVITEVNSALESSPEWVNADPFGKAWLVRVTASDLKEMESLMDAAAYERFVAEEEAKGEH
jgi:glycine cleavage system H protein